MRRPRRGVSYRNHPWARQRFTTRLDLASFDDDQEDSSIEQRGKDLSNETPEESYITAVGDRVSDSGNSDPLVNSPEVVVVVNDDTSLNNDDIDDDGTSPSSTKGQNDDTAQANGYEPIRIRAVLTEDSGKYLSVEEKNYLIDEILHPAMSAWSEALRVYPVDGNLTLDASQLWDGESCGPGKDSVSFLYKKFSLDDFK